MTTMKRTQGYTKQLRFRALAALFIIGTFILASLIIIQALIFREASSSRVINLAGRQRMLSQRIAKDALVLSQTTDTSVSRVYLDELADTVASFEQSHLGLQEGSLVLGLPGGNTRSISSLFQLIETDFQQIVSSANCILTL